MQPLTNYRQSPFIHASRTLFSAYLSSRFPFQLKESTIRHARANNGDRDARSMSDMACRRPHWPRSHTRQPKLVRLTFLSL
ncbi:hypothetical protein BSIN_2728 [Burkholderia singularis]|uniref:Uncharacterized protein n=1 Tax=Burkholderia singularis TaxID=1503053 RepID=A0A238H0X6_9BURK|nr:hypothetical protein BSIN_2728 [Burkholderia singularis]